MDVSGKITGLIKSIASMFGQNSTLAYLILILCIALGLAALVLKTRSIVARRMDHWIAKSGRYGKVDRALAADVVKASMLLMALVPLYWVLDALVLTPSVQQAVNSVFLIVLTFSVVRCLANFAGFILDAALRGGVESSSPRQGAGALMPIVKIVVWTLGLTFLLDNLGFKISSIVAGLGIMGVAVGLAGQAILTDFFSYLVILMDQPFGIGDTLYISGVGPGRVERIGIKTTRIRMATGEVIVCPNGDLTKQRVTNFHPAKQRTKVITFGVTYETPPAVLRAIPGMIHEIAANVYNLRVERVHFTGFGPSSLDFEVGLSTQGSDGVALLDAVQDFNFALVERFSAEGIEFAYPTSRVLMQEPGETYVDAIAAKGNS